MGDSKRSVVISRPVCLSPSTTKRKVGDLWAARQDDSARPNERVTKRYVDGCQVADHELREWSDLLSEAYQLYRSTDRLQIKGLRRLTVNSSATRLAVTPDR